MKAIVAYKDQCNFAEIIPVSALEGNNTDDLVHLFLNIFQKDQCIMMRILSQTSRNARLWQSLSEKRRFVCYSQEIPHGIAVVIERMKTRKNGNIVDIKAVIVCERESHKRIIIGKKGDDQRNRYTGKSGDGESLDMKVNLRLWVKVRKDRRDSDILLKNYGYNKKEL